MGFHASGRKIVAASLSLGLASVLFGGLSLARPAAEEDRPGGQSELTTREVQPTFRIKVERNLVVLRVVVRDAQGKAVRNLKKDDFRILDRGKPQIISQFGVEFPSQKTIPQAAAISQADELEVWPEGSGSTSTPWRYLALYFDDVHTRFDELARVRDAADRYLASFMLPGDRVGIFTSSGQAQMDFTDDHAQIRHALFQLQQRPIAGQASDPCPKTSDYQAYLMIHQHDPYATEIASLETVECRYNGDQRYLQQAQSEAFADAIRVLNLSETESEATLRGVDQLARRMASLPGKRALVLVSGGFFTETLRLRLDEIADRALRADVIINGLDARGLYAPLPGGDIDKRVIVIPRRVDAMGRKQMIELDGIRKSSEGMQNLALDTGGTFFANSNDLDLGMRRVGALADVSYVLAFSPQNLKMDGAFHDLKVRLVHGEKLMVQARRGYFAPRKPADRSAQEKEEIEQALFSQDEINELPIEVHTQFFKVNDTGAKLSVLTHLDIRQLHFRKEDGRNLNNLTFVTGLFDRDGKLITAKQKLIEFRLYDPSLERLSQTGLSVKASFDVPPGAYLVREVVRDAEGSQLTSMNRSVEIPY
jgi:VWFA-related protein